MSVAKYSYFSALGFSLSISRIVSHLIAVSASLSVGTGVSESAQLMDESSPWNTYTPPPYTYLPGKIFPSERIEQNALTVSRKKIVSLSLQPLEVSAPVPNFALTVIEIQTYMYAHAPLLPMTSLCS